MALQLSIIVPVYKVEQYIRSCIESVYRQGSSKVDLVVAIFFHVILCPYNEKRHFSFYLLGNRRFYSQQEELNKN